MHEATFNTVDYQTAGDQFQTVYFVTFIIESTKR